jgi:hypothetical protein
MSEQVAPTVWIGTREGLLRWQAGAVTPVAPDVTITALARLPGGRVAAGHAGGELLVVGRDGRVVRRVVLPDQSVPTSILAIAGPVDAWWVATKVGHLLEISGGGASVALRWQAPDAPLFVLPIPGRPRAALLLQSGAGLWLLPDPARAPERWSEDGAAILSAAAHPFDGYVWLARTERELLRSIDGGRRFRPIGGLPAELRPRALHWSDQPQGVVLAVAHPSLRPPDPGDPSPVWSSRDGGQQFCPIPSRRIDGVRDPVGELTCAASWTTREGQWFVLGTDCGELLGWDGGNGGAELLCDALPPIDHLLASGAAPLLDPSSSGVFLLP